MSVQLGQQFIRETVHPHLHAFEQDLESTSTLTASCFSSLDDSAVSMTLLVEIFQLDPVPWNKFHLRHRFNNIPLTTNGFHDCTCAFFDMILSLAQQLHPQ
jgi:hypothetical protein